MDHASNSLHKGPAWKPANEGRQRMQTFFVPILLAPTLRARSPQLA
jgi:hypothetical protein